MLVKEMFKKPIDREIQGVIIVGQGEETNVSQELDEYVVTRELQKHYTSLISSPHTRKESSGPHRRWAYGFPVSSEVVNRTS